MGFYFLTDNYLPQLLIHLETEISLCNKKSYSQFPDLYEPVQAANVKTANNAKINFFILSPFCVFLHSYIMEAFLIFCKFFIYIFLIYHQILYIRANLSWIYSVPVWRIFWRSLCLRSCCKILPLPNQIRHRP